MGFVKGVLAPERSRHLPTDRPQINDYPYMLWSRQILRADMESAPTVYLWGFRPRRGQCGERFKSVKKNAALLHFLAFESFDHIIGVPRGEQPLGRGSLPRNSETFFASFFGHKKGRSNGCSPLIRGAGRRVASDGSANIPKNANSVPPQIRLLQCYNVNYSTLIM